MVYYYKARTNLYSYYYTSSVILYRTNLLPNNFLNYLGWSVDIIIDKAGRLALIDPFNAFDYWSSLWTFNSLYFLWLLLWFLSICVDSLKWNTCFFLACSKWQNSLWKNLAHRRCNKAATTTRVLYYSACEIVDNFYLSTLLCLGFGRISVVPFEFLLFPIHSRSCEVFGCWTRRLVMSLWEIFLSMLLARLFGLKGIVVFFLIWSLISLLSSVKLTVCFLCGFLQPWPNQDPIGAVHSQY